MMNVVMDVSQMTLVINVMMIGEWVMNAVINVMILRSIFYDVCDDLKTKINVVTDN